MSRASRRSFLKASLTAACAMGVSGGPSFAAASTAQPVSRSQRLSLQKGVVWNMLPKTMSTADRFQLAHDVGFEVVQVPTEPDERKAQQIKAAAEKANVRIDSIMNGNHWKYPLSSSDPAAVAKGLEGMRTSFENANLWGADAVLLVPAIVTSQTSYLDAWKRSQKNIRTLLPRAQELKVSIAIEDVWNDFLLSPLEMAKYIDEFQSPWVRSWFDVGNVVMFGYPQDWIRTLGKRIVKLHLKDFKREHDGYAWVNLGDGDIDWPAVRSALQETGYSGSAIVEMKAGDEAYLRDVSNRVDRLLLGRS